jgi:hypothetical protein
VMGAQTLVGTSTVLRLSWSISVTEANAGIVPLWGHDSLLPNHQSSYTSTLYILTASQTVTSPREGNCFRDKLKPPLHHCSLAPYLLRGPLTQQCFSCEIWPRELLRFHITLNPLSQGDQYGGRMGV